MTDINIPPEAVEAAVRALSEADHGTNLYAELARATEGGIAMSDIVTRLNRGEGCSQEGGQTCISMDAESGCICAIAADTIAALTARVKELEKTLFFVERWAVYKRYKPDGKNLTAEEAIGIIAFYPAIRDITKRYEAAGEIDVAAYERDRAAITKGESND